MPASASPSDLPSALRTGLSAGKSLLGGLMLGIALALLVGCTTAVMYFLRLKGPGMPAGAHAGGAGALMTLLFSPAYPAVRVGRMARDLESKSHIPES